MFGLTRSRDDRRRRVLTEDVITTPGRSPHATRTVGEEGEPTANYSEAANLEHHPRVSQFIPRRGWAVGLFAFLLVSAVGGLLWAYHALAEAEAARVAEHLTAFDLAQPGSLASWLSTMALAAAALCSLLIYTLRRHKLDDYQGRYRQWMWLAGVLAALSVTAVAPVHQSLAAVMVSLTGWSALGGAVWWIVPAGLLLVAFGFRLVVEVRRCRLATVALLIAANSYLVALLVPFTTILAASPVERAMLLVGSQMLGHAMLLLATVSYARFVLRDIQGLVPPPAVREANRGKDDQDEKATPSYSSHGKAGRARTIDSPHDRVPEPKTAARSTDLGTDYEEDWEEDSPRRSRRLRQKAPASARSGHRFDDASEEAEEPAQPRRLTKSERKRLRKLKAEQRARG